MEFYDQHMFSSKDTVLGGIIGERRSFGTENAVTMPPQTHVVLMDTCNVLIILEDDDDNEKACKYPPQTNMIDCVSCVCVSEDIYFSMCMSPHHRLIVSLRTSRHHTLC